MNTQKFFKDFVNMCMEAFQHKYKQTFTYQLTETDLIKITFEKTYQFRMSSDSRHYELLQSLMITLEGTNEDMYAFTKIEDFMTIFTTIENAIDFVSNDKDVPHLNVDFFECSTLTMTQENFQKLVYKREC